MYQLSGDGYFGEVRRNVITVSQESSSVESVLYKRREYCYTVVGKADSSLNVANSSSSDSGSCEENE